MFPYIFLWPCDWFAQNVTHGDLDELELFPLPLLPSPHLKMMTRTILETFWGLRKVSDNLECSFWIVVNGPSWFRIITLGILYLVAFSLPYTKAYLVSYYFKSKKKKNDKVTNPSYIYNLQYRRERQVCSFLSFWPTSSAQPCNKKDIYS